MGVPRGNHRAVVRKLLKTYSDMVLQDSDLPHICAERPSANPLGHRAPLTLLTVVTSSKLYINQ